MSSRWLDALTWASLRFRVAGLSLVAGCAVLVVAGTADAHSTPGPRAWAVIAMTPGVLSLPWRRRCPTLVWWVAVVPNVVHWLLVGSPQNGGLVVSLCAAAYGVGRWEGVRRRSRLVLVSLFPVLLLHELLDPLNTDARQVVAALPFDAVMYVAWLGGALVRSRAEQAASHADRVAAAERTRIARELHDIVAHCLGVIVVQAEGAAEVIDRDPVRAKQALERISETGRGSLVELRHALGVLRGDGPAAVAPQPGLARLDELLDTVRQTGLEVTHDSKGEPTELPPGADLAAYRVIQEALTNTLRHAGARRATVRKVTTPAELWVEVTDDGRATDRSSGRAGSGLLGIRERVALLGGRVETAPRPGGGFRVAAWIPAEAPRD